MAGWREHKGLAIALPLHNVDTDQLIPARFMSTPRGEGYGQFLLHDLRRTHEGEADAEFPLNRHQNASVLVTGRNFGSGSSREAAVYALVDAGVRAVIAPSFGDIFSSNAVNNGLLPAKVTEEEVTALFEALGTGSHPVRIELDTGRIAVAGKEVSFALDESWRTKLINGWDDIDLTRRHTAHIQNHKENRGRTAAWAWPATPGPTV